MVGNEEIGWMCILGGGPLRPAAFFKYHGMTAEKENWPGLGSSRNFCTQKADVQIRLLLLRGDEGSHREEEKPRQKGKA